MERLFSWFDPIWLLGNKEEIENGTKFPLQSDETLWMDEKGAFHRLKVPSEKSGFWPKIVFCMHTLFNQNRHMEAIDKLFILMDERLLDKAYLVHQEYEEVNQHIAWLNSLKNDYGITTLGQGNLLEIDHKLKELENRANHLYALYLNQMEMQEKKDAHEIFLQFFKESQAILLLLFQESAFGMHETNRLRKAYRDDVALLFPQRLNHVQARLLLVQDLSEAIENMHERRLTKEFKERLNKLQGQLNDEVDKLEAELELLAKILEELSYENVCDLTFDKEQPLPKKILTIQEHLDQLAA